MVQTDMKRIIKRTVGITLYSVATMTMRKLIEENVKKSPHKEIAIQLSTAFWGICATLYDYYVVGEKS